MFSGKVCFFLENMCSHFVRVAGGIHGVRIYRKALNTDEWNRSERLLYSQSIARGCRLDDNQHTVTMFSGQLCAFCGSLPSHTHIRLLCLLWHIRAVLSVRKQVLEEYVVSESIGKISAMALSNGLMDLWASQSILREHFIESRQTCASLHLPVKSSRGIYLRFRDPFKWFRK